MTNWLEILFKIFLLCVIGWLIFNYLLPMLPEPLRKIVTIFLVLVAIVILVGFLGIVPGLRI